MENDHTTDDVGNSDEQPIPSERTPPATNIDQAHTQQIQEPCHCKSAGTDREHRFFTETRTAWWPIVVASVLSLFTILLLSATVFYAHNQWCEMVRSSDAAVKTASYTEKAFKQVVETAQLNNRARLIFDRFDPYIEADAYRVRCVTRNYGLTRAFGISVRQLKAPPPKRGQNETESPPKPTPKPTPILGGDILEAGAHRDFCSELHWEGPTGLDNPFTVAISVSWVDVFGKADNITECRFHDRSRGGWVPCYTVPKMILRD